MAVRVGGNDGELLGQVKHKELSDESKVATAVAREGVWARGGRALKPQLMFSLLALLRSSTTLPHLHQIHAQTITNALPLDTHLLSKLAALRLPSPDYPLAVFRRLPSPDDHAFTALIRSLSSSAPSSALLLYSRMLRCHLRPSAFTLPAVLKSAASLSAPVLARQLHAHVVKLGFSADLVTSNSLIDLYSKLSIPKHAAQVLEDMPDPDVVSFNSLIAGYLRCGDVRSAREVFDVMPAERTVVSWTAMMDGLGRAGMVAEMLHLFRWMLVSVDDVRPNCTTMVCLLSACADASDSAAGMWVSKFVDVNAMSPNPILSTALVNMYSRCGELGKARGVFDGIKSKCLVTWNAMLTGYVQCGQSEEGIRLFRSMRLVSVVPNEITMVNVLSACASLGSLELGREAHRYLAGSGMQLNQILVTALVDMYSKCGSIDDACLAFVKSGEKDTILWNAIILGLAVHGHGREALMVFGDMERIGPRPNDATFIGVLAACCHSGLVEEGKANFKKMFGYGLSPKVDHYASMVDLLGRSGHLDDALALVRSMTVPPDSVIWGSLLSACRIHNNVELADQVGQYMFSSDDPGLGCCILLSNIYASASRWADVARVRGLMKEKGMRKPSGCSWIELDGVVHKFAVEDLAHMQSLEVYVMLRRLMHQLSLNFCQLNSNFDLEYLDQT